MNDINPVEMVRQRHEAEAVIAKRRYEEYEYAADDAAIRFFLRAEATFIQHLQETQFPGAQILKMNDEDYLYYQLFDTTYGDGETHFTAQRALYLLVNEHGEFSYGRETTMSGMTGRFRGPKPEPFVLPADVESLKSHNKNDRLPGISSGLSRFDYIELAANLINIQQRHSGGLVEIDGTKYGGAGVWDINRQIDKVVIPEKSSF
jgi:hypothetical protein